VPGGGIEIVERRLVAARYQVESRIGNERGTLPDLCDGRDTLVAECDLGGSREVPIGTT
jgi:hypothetical protein